MTSPDPRTQWREKAAARRADPRINARDNARRRLRWEKAKDAVNARKREVRARLSKGRTWARLSDIPLDLRPIYLKAREQFGAAHARKIIADHLAAEKRRARL